MGKKLGIVAIVISIIAVVVSCIAIFKANSTTTAKSEEIQYVMYLGTNDKDTNSPVFSEEESKNKAETILANYFDGFTVQEAKGGWKNDDGSIAHEYTLVIILSDTNLDQVHKAAAELQKTFNQSSVMIQQNTSKTEFYSAEK
ncbi:MAG: DUF3574 domain-containing protein [Lachnospiraceae bacterium]|nr:DUF3574 domain-containing protein [Lachnospiraceae bacterium]